MFKFFIEGLVLGLAYTAPIGMQNMYVINSALRFKKIKAFETALITIFFDISLSLSCFWGIGSLIKKFYIIKLVLLLAGSIVVIFIGVKLIKSDSKIENNAEINESFSKTVLSCFIVTWLNPQAIIDGSLLIGNFRSSLNDAACSFFIMGVCTASFIWFNSLTAVTSIFKQKFNSKIIKTVNIICGIIIIYYGIKLGFNFFMSL